MSLAASRIELEDAGRAEEYEAASVCVAQLRREVVRRLAKLRTEQSVGSVPEATA